MVVLKWLVTRITNTIKTYTKAEREGSDFFGILIYGIILNRKRLWLLVIISPAM